MCPASSAPTCTTSSGASSNETAAPTARPRPRHRLLGIVTAGCGQFSTHATADAATARLQSDVATVTSAAADGNTAGARTALATLHTDLNAARGGALTPDPICKDQHGHRLRHRRPDENRYPHDLFLHHLGTLHGARANDGTHRPAGSRLDTRNEGARPRPRQGRWKRLTPAAGVSSDISVTTGRRRGRRRRERRCQRSTRPLPRTAPALAGAEAGVRPRLLHRRGDIPIAGRVAQRDELCGSPEDDHYGVRVEAGVRGRVGPERPGRAGAYCE